MVKSHRVSSHPRRRLWSFKSNVLENLEFQKWCPKTRCSEFVFFDQVQNDQMIRF